jgi:hypothetical protein
MLRRARVGDRPLRAGRWLAPLCLLACDSAPSQPPSDPVSDPASDLQAVPETDPVVADDGGSPGPSVDEPSPAPATGATTLSGGRADVCQPPVAGPCAAGLNARGVDETLAAASGQSVAIGGVIVEVDTRCTRSVPAHCASSLALRDASGKGRTVVLVDASGTPAFSCNDECCALASDGTRHVATGTLRDADATAALEVASICVVP